MPRLRFCLLTALAACQFTPPSGIFQCESDGECPEGQQCELDEPVTGERHCYLNPPVHQRVADGGSPRPDASTGRDDSSVPEAGSDLGTCLDLGLGTPYAACTPDGGGIGSRACSNGRPTGPCVAFADRGDGGLFLDGGLTDGGHKDAEVTGDAGQCVANLLDPRLKQATCTPPDGGLGVRMCTGNVPVGPCLSLGDLLGDGGFSLPDSGP